MRWASACVPHDFNQLYANDSQTPPATRIGKLAEDDLLELAPPASNASVHITRASAALPVRVEQLCSASRCWLRIVAVEQGVERISAWTLWQDAAAPLLSRSKLSGQDVLLLDGGGGIVALRIARNRD